MSQDKDPIAIPQAFRNRLQYQPQAHVQGLDPAKLPEVLESDKYSYFADRQMKWAHWTNQFGAKLLVGLFGYTQKCIDINTARIRDIVVKKLAQEFQIDPTKVQERCGEDRITKEVDDAIKQGEEIYGSKENLKKEYVTWTQEEYQNAGLQLQYIKLKSIQRYTESWAATIRLHNKGYFEKLMSRVREEQKNPEKLTIRMVSLGGGPAFELLAVRDYFNLYYPDQVHFIGVSMDIDEVWRDYANALGFEFAQWDCRKRYDGKDHVELTASAAALQNKIATSKDKASPEEIDKMKDDLRQIRRELFGHNYIPFDQTICQSLHTIDENIYDQFLMKKIDANILGLSAKPAHPQDEHAPVFTQDDKHKDRMITIDLCVISYAFLMYMSDSYQLHSFWNTLYDFNQTDKSHITPKDKGKMDDDDKDDAPASNEQSSSSSSSSSEPKSSEKHDEGGDKKGYHNKEQRPRGIINAFNSHRSLPPVVSSELLSMKGMLILERVRSIEPLRKEYPTAARKLAGVFLTPLPRDNDDRQLLITRHTLSNASLQQVYQKQQDYIKEKMSQMSEDKILATPTSYTYPISTEAINPYHLPLDVNYEAELKHYANELNLDPHPAVARICFPNVPYNDDLAKLRYNNNNTNAGRDYDRNDRNDRNPSSGGRHHRQGGHHNHRDNRGSDGRSDGRDRNRDYGQNRHGGHQNQNQNQNRDRDFGYGRSTDPRHENAESRRRAEGGGHNTNKYNNSGAYPPRSTDPRGQNAEFRRREGGYENFNPPGYNAYHPPNQYNAHPGYGGNQMPQLPPPPQPPAPTQPPRGWGNPNQPPPRHSAKHQNEANDLYQNYLNSSFPSANQPTSTTSTTTSSSNRQSHPRQSFKDITQKNDAYDSIGSIPDQ